MLRIQRFILTKRTETGRGGIPINHLKMSMLERIAGSNRMSRYLELPARLHMRPKSTQISGEVVGDSMFRRQRDVMDHVNTFSHIRNNILDYLLPSIGTNVVSS